MKKIFLGVLALITSVALLAAPRTAEQAAEIAAEFTNAQPQLSRMHKAPRTAATMKLVHTALKPASDEAAYYVFNQENNGGAVFISADDRTLDVLGYTVKGQFNPETVNPNFKWWLERYAKEIANVNDENAYPVSAVRKAQQVTEIAPLLVDKNGNEITWYQESPYWNLCPSDCGGTSLTGCVATAASQIMFSWRWPEKGTGEHSYTWYKCTTGFDYYGYCNDDGTPTTLTVDYGSTTYDWDNMLPAYKGKTSTTAQKTAVATLMYHAGVACEMDYTSEGSGAWTDDMAAGLRDYFGYRLTKFICSYTQSKYESNNLKGKPVADVPYEFGLTAADFETYFNADLEAGRPILMGGDSQQSGGHEFVCCGRNANGKFYFNWGWEGEDNGYFSLTSLKPTGYNFSEHIDAIIGLEPDIPEDPFDVTWKVNGETFATTSCTGKVVLPENEPSACADGKVFVGWCKDADYSSETTAPAFVKANDVVTEGAVFYAVFATASEGGAPTTTTYTFNSKAWDDATHSWTSDKDGSQYNNSNQGVQVTTTTTGAGATTKEELSNITDIVVNYCTNNKEGKGTITMSAGSKSEAQTVTKPSSSGGGTTHKDFNFNLGGASGKLSIKVDCTQNSIYVSSITVTAGAGTKYSNYSTTCSGTPSAVENNAAKTTSIKRIEDGQLVIEVNGVKYNVFGQTIE